MNIHEYQAKKILMNGKIPVPPFGIASHLSEVDSLIETLHLKDAVIKIQVHAGGRGKAGGVKFAKSPEEIKNISQKLIGMKMVNHQTGPEGVIAHKVLIAAPITIEKEYYLGAIIDRERRGAILIASPEGGMEIEDIAEKHPDKILKIPIQFDGTLHSFHLFYLMKFMGWDGSLKEQGLHLVKEFAKIFMETDASLLEINPLVLSQDQKLWALDAKLSLDDNALYRHPEIASMYDPSQYSANEVKAKESDLSYIALDGNIGCMVNGAGLAMATMDLIQYAGGKPANFLDVGGSATVDKIAAGFNILMADPKVKAIFINIFGGIMSCETIAEGIITACRENSIKVPIVVRMEGTHVAEGKEKLKKSQLHIITEDSLEKAARLIVQEAHAHSHR